MLLNLSELLTIDGKERDYEAALDEKEFRYRLGCYPIEQKSPVRIHIVHKGKRKLTLTGDYDVILKIPCSRCLEPVDWPIQESFEADVDLDMTDAERAEALDEQPYVTGNELDVDCLIQGEILLNLPNKVLCSQECKGLCRVCGTNLNQNTCNCAGEESGNLRMSKFEEFFKANNFKEV